jgi:endo-alpha-1,4-polygalactosaminidase (GH114 family)
MRERGRRCFVVHTVRRGLPLLLLAGLIAAVPAGTASAGPVDETTLVPISIIDTKGSHTGDVAALAVRDQSGAEDDPSKYVRFGAPGESYAGFRVYTLPTEVSPSSITTITLMANYHGPIVSRDEFTWSIFDWVARKWVRLGNQNHCGGDAGTQQWPCNDLSNLKWKNIQYNAIGSLPRYVNGSSGRIRIRLASRGLGGAKLDFESLSVYSNGGAVGDLYHPAVDTRWQWQLEAEAGVFPDTNGINVDICERSFLGGPCVRPDLFDIDPYVDHNIAGRYGYPFDTAAVEAIHASGRHVIGYVAVGDIERFRPDYQQFVDFDQRCGGCLIGNPFSKTFPDEFWANLNNRYGQRDFMLQMIRARMDRVAAIGFDGIETDIMDAYANGERYTGWDVSYRTQLDYNIALADMAHADGLSIALKNDGGQISDLVGYFDYAINEQCFQYSECRAWRAFVADGKPVFQAEYRVDPSTFCPKANSWDFNSILKSRDYSLFDLPWTPCR